MSKIKLLLSALPSNLPLPLGLLSLELASTQLSTCHVRNLRVLFDTFSFNPHTSPYH